MPIQTIDTQDATITIETRPTGDGSGTARTVTSVPKAGTPQANQDAIQGRARQALGVNAAYLALVSPTNTQVAAQVMALTRECSAVIRLLLGQLDTAADT